MKKKKKRLIDGSRIDTLIFYGGQDPDMPNLPPEELKELFDKAKPKLQGIKGKTIIVGTAGSFEKNDFKKLCDESTKT